MIIPIIQLYGANFLLSLKGKIATFKGVFFAYKFMSTYIKILINSNGRGRK